MSLNYLGSELCEEYTDLPWCIDVFFFFLNIIKCFGRQSASIFNVEGIFQKKYMNMYVSLSYSSNLNLV